MYPALTHTPPRPHDYMYLNEPQITQNLFYWRPTPLLNTYPACPSTGKSERAAGNCQFIFICVPKLLSAAGHVPHSHADTSLLTLKSPHRTSGGPTNW